MKKLTVVLALTILCLSCASAPKGHWERANLTQEQWEREKYDCKYRAELVCHVYGPGNDLTRVPANIECFKRQFHDCLRMKGYVWVKE